eukprot:GHVT01073008.1.p1 GENE.GHVT01073008.1~~GHVT01073008.1.p1  ORF type:complete len:179 (-),score=41.04 GHVT01073008.1:233-769(-)
MQLTALDAQEKTENQQQDLWAADAIQYYAQVLAQAKLSNSHDLLSVSSRLLCLWFRYGPTRDDANKRFLAGLLSAGGRGTRRLWPFIYQIASLISAPSASSSTPSASSAASPPSTSPMEPTSSSPLATAVNTPNNNVPSFQTSLNEVLKQMIYSNPFHCLPPVMALRFGKRIGNTQKE